MSGTPIGIDALPLAGTVRSSDWLMIQQGLVTAKVPAPTFFSSVLAGIPTSYIGLPAGSMWTDGVSFWIVADVAAIIATGAAPYLKKDKTGLPPGVLWNNGGVAALTAGSTQLPLSAAGLAFGVPWNNGGVVCLALGSILPTSPGAIGTFWNNNNVLCVVTA